VKQPQDIRDLQSLEELVGRALDGGGDDGLRVLGHGEISCVLAWKAGEGEVACKRLPLFSSAPELEGYQRALLTYLDRLEATGVRVLPTRLQSLPRADGKLAAYCLQPVLPQGSLAPAAIARLPQDQALAVLGRIASAIEGTVSPRLGIDGQLCNWALVDDQLWYLDITTPMARDEAGRELLDAGVFLASLPWAIRGIAHRFILESVLQKYYSLRGVLLDLAGNLYKERLDALIPGFLQLANKRLERAINEDEVRRYYRRDARTWALLQWLRRADRFWQRHVRRRTYPFLLPAAIQR
jgi:hypothetical protein